MRERIFWLRAALAAFVVLASLATGGCATVYHAAKQGVIR